VPAGAVEILNAVLRLGQARPGWAGSPYRPGREDSPWHSTFG
jgi:hypothetical protein